MADSALYMSLAVKARIVLKTKLDGATDDGVSINHPVCLGNEFTIETSWVVCA